MLVGLTKWQYSHNKLLCSCSQSIKGEKSALVSEGREGEMEEDEHAVHQFQVAAGK